jgi:aminopeptidase N
VSRSSNTWEFRLRQARDLAVTLSTEYHRIVTVAPNGVQIELYTLDDAQPSEGAQFDGPLHALETASAALELFADLYGPYPHNRLVVVESEFPDGMEFSGIVFVGGEWFRSYSGDPASYLTLITAHEVAHQWWYDLVGSNQSAEPWLDESLCTYSEFVFLEENYPQLTDWWWRFRVYSWGPDGLVDSSVYAFDNTRAYINAVYLRGATLLHELRAVMGGETFFAWLNTYASTMKGQIADANDLWHAMSDDALQRTTEIRKRFLRHPGGTE